MNIKVGSITCTPMKPGDVIVGAIGTKSSEGWSTISHRSIVLDVDSPDELDVISDCHVRCVVIVMTDIGEIAHKTAPSYVWNNWLRSGQIQIGS